MEDVTKEVNLYVRCMAEIKERMNFIRSEYAELAVREGASILVFEGACLQLRKIIELIAFASLVTNRAKYEVEWRTFAKEKDFAKLAKRLAKINSNCLPTSVVISATKIDGKWDIRDHPNQLSMSDLVSTHGRLGNVLHARNPYRDVINYAEYQSLVRNQSKSLIGALRNHVAILETGEHVLVKMMGNSEAIRPNMLKEV